MSEFQKLGLTNKEEEAYIFLLKEGALRGKEISKGIGVHYPVIYRILSALENKGWIEASTSRPKIYKAKPISEAVENALSLLISDLEKSAENVINKFKNISVSRKIGEKETFVYKGWKNTLLKIKELSRIVEKSVYLIGKDIGRKEVEKFLEVISNIKGYANAYLTGSNLEKLESNYPQVNLYCNKSEFEPSANRFVSIYIIFDEKEVIISYLQYKENELIEERVFSVYETDPQFIEILMEGSGLKL